MTLLTIKKVAAEIDVAYHTAYALVASGEIPYTNVSRGTVQVRYRVDPSDLAKWKQSRRSQS